MQQTMRTLEAVLMVVVIAGWMGGGKMSAFAKAPVEVTGQTILYATGDDGDIQAGVPFPKKRFLDKGDGTVVDNLTGLIWLQNANCDVLRITDWATTVSDVNGLGHGSCGLSDGSIAGDWRLPNVKELQSLIDLGHANPALPADHSFSRVQSTYYWSSTTSAGNPDYAWVVDLGGGTTIDHLKGSASLVWPVRGGN